MQNFKIVPVMDILNSQVVHAIRGDRKNYQPMESSIVKTNKPIEFLLKIKELIKINEFYIADLDAIQDHTPNIEIIKKLINKNDVNFMLDPGIRKKGDLIKYSNLGDFKLIFGLETINDYTLLREGIKFLGNKKMIVSVDLFNGKLLNKPKNFNADSVIDVVQFISDLGIEEIILLDLYRVGQKIGGIPPLYLEIRDNFDIKIFIGGGIKSLKDIKMHFQNKFNGVLIGTALYDGTIPIEKLIKFINSNQ
ncbi:MAG: hypothetical protein GF317_15905 [Candidatus Lokiarchaeota archaeon]|nr:hypothetical protein [Candidatus Lokiarchaeota archaeon]MBD3201032.1 hypothetical protein [Candidatus Lokiarchaeota archaeon]